MAQIMRYWSYPAKGTGSSSYSCTTANGYKDNYGTLSANYGTTTYNWTSMPLANASITSSASTYSAVATLMYQCGVSVDMNYDPSGSGAQVLSVDAGGGPCAQQSYTLYFGYDASTIQGYQRTQGGYSDAAWLNLIETDLNAGRPVQYAGQDPSQGGHTWVCDGYDVNNNVHMNWGWAGSDDGYFSINNLLTTNGGFNPSTNHEILVGIQPPPGVDAGIASVVSPTGVLCASTFTPVVTIKNYGVNTLTSCTIHTQLDGGTTLSYSWTGSLTTGQTANVNLPAITTTSGSHTLTSATSNPNMSVDANTANDQSAATFVINAVGATLPLVEGFESSTALPAGWSIYNPDADAAWQVVTNVAHTGSHCLGFNNCDGDNTTDMTGRKDWVYTATYNFSGASSGSLSFDVGYIPANDGTKTYTDTLIVYYSVDCGTTWNQLYKKGGMTLATGPVFTYASTSTVTCANPTSSQWRTDVSNLTNVAGYSKVEFAFENISDWGDWLYIDNINITANSTTGIANVSSNSGIVVYPNPAHNTINFTGIDNASAVSVCDMIGQTVIAEQKTGSSQAVQTMDISSLANGVYLMKISTLDGQVKIIRFIKN